MAILKNADYSGNVRVEKIQLKEQDFYGDKQFFLKKNVLLLADFEFTDDDIFQITRDFTPELILSTFYAKLESKYNIICVPQAFYDLSIPIAKTVSSSETQYNTETNYCFNFSVNRKRINRHILIKLVEWFKLSSMDYTWSAADVDYDMSEIIKEFHSISSPPWPDEFTSFMLSSITLPNKWIDVEGDIKVDLLNIRPKNNSTVWNAGLDKLVEQSAVTLISESIDYQAGVGYTEKTAFALFGKTFPIWVGGKYQAEQFAKLGYDTFDDVIDHSYQYKDTLIERCYHAFADNLKILTDIEYATNLRNSLDDRLVANRQKLLNDCLDPTLATNNLYKFTQDLPANENLNKQIAGAVRKSFIKS